MRLGAALLGVIFVAFSPVAWSQAPPRPEIDNSTEVEGFDAGRPGAAPSDLVSLGDDLFAIVDHVEKSIVFSNAEGRQVRKTALPFNVGRVITRETSVTLISRDGRLLVRWPRSPSLSVPPETVVAGIGQEGADRQDYSFHRRYHASAKLVPPANVRPATALQMKSSSSCYYLTSGNFIGSDASGARYSLMREIYHFSEEEAEASPYCGQEISGREFKEDDVGLVFANMIVGRHDSTGRRVQIGEIKLDWFRKLPLGSYVTVAPSGSVYALVPSEKKAMKLVEIPMVDETLGRKVETRKLLSAAQTRETTLAGGVAARTLELPTDMTVEGHPLDGGKLDTLGAARMRNVIRSYLTFKWTPSPANLGVGSGRTESMCVPAAGKDWLRPHNLSTTSTGRLQVGVPYNWGGKLSVAEIKSEIEGGKLAGNICAHGDKARKGTTGIDFSGLVAHVWGFPQPKSVSTRTLNDTSSRVDSFGRIKFADAFNRPGEHVRLVIRRETPSDAGMMIRTVEAATSCGGVCERLYHVEHFHRYKLIRRRQ